MFSGRRTYEGRMRSGSSAMGFMRVRRWVEEKGRVRSLVVVVYRHGRIRCCTREFMTVEAATKQLKTFGIDVRSTVCSGSVSNV